jgi:O-antigen/teichoic acid export membrane protein
MTGEAARPSLFGDVTVFGLAFGMSSVLSYVYVLVAGRTLAEAEFGVFNALLGLITLASFFATSVQLAATQAAADPAGARGLTSLVRTTLVHAAPMIVAIALVGMPFASEIGASAGHVALLGAIFVVMFATSAALGFLAGIGKIRSQAGVNLAGNVARLGAGVPLMIAGGAVFGAIAGYLASYVVMLPLAMWIGSRAAGGGGSGSARLGLDRGVMIVFALAFAPYSLDQLLVQVVAPALGGRYAAIATIAKLGLFVTYPVIAVVYPRLLKLADPRQRTRLLAQATLAVVGIAAVSAALLSGLGSQALALFFGDRFADVEPHVPLLSVGVACFSVSALGAHALIVWRSRLGFVPPTAALIVGVILYVARHATLAEIVVNQAVAYGVQLVLTVVCVMLALRAER